MDVISVLCARSNYWLVASSFSRNSGLVVCLQSPATDDAKIKDKKKKAVKSIELPLEVKTHGMSAVDLQNYIDQEVIIYDFRLNNGHIIID